MIRVAAPQRSEETKAMAKYILCVSMLALVAAADPAHAAEQTAGVKRVLPGVSSPPGLTRNDCETAIRKLDASEAQGEERLAEKQEVIDQCLGEYKHDKTVARLVQDCAKYEEQPVVKQQFVAECQLAAFNYANALRALKAEHRK